MKMNSDGWRFLRFLQNSIVLFTLSASLASSADPALTSEKVIISEKDQSADRIAAFTDMMESSRKAIRALNESCERDQAHHKIKSRLMNLDSIEDLETRWTAKTGEFGNVFNSIQRRAISSATLESSYCHERSPSDSQRYYECIGLHRDASIFAILSTEASAAQEEWARATPDLKQAITCLIRRPDIELIGFLKELVDNAIQGADLQISGSRTSLDLWSQQALTN